MNEIKRGYPNPNYTEQDITPNGKIEIDPGTVMVDVRDYERLVSKATALDILSAAMKRKGEVSDDIVWAVTGAEPEIPIREMKEKADNYWGYYTEEKKKTEALESKVADLKKYIDSLMPAEDEEEGGNG